MIEPPRPLPDLREIAADHGLRTEFDRDLTLEDRDLCCRVPGKLGFIRPHNDTRLSVTSKARKTFSRLFLIDGMSEVSASDRQFVGTFPISQLPAVASIIKAHSSRS